MIGRRFAHYVVLSVLGSGGMGVVYRARDEHLEREVALKILPEDALSDPAARRRFRREALTLSRLNHPNIAVVHNFDHQDGLDFLIQELIPGETLAERLVRGPLPEAEIRTLGVQIADAIRAAHASKIIHRDLKPANIMVTPEGRVKVLDFGLALRLPGAGEAGSLIETRTQENVLTGTIAYMAPEQLRGKPADERSDLFSLGVILYEMTTGRRPFDAPNAIALAYSILNEETPVPSKLTPAISPSLEGLIEMLLARDATHRPASAAEVLVRLRGEGSSGAEDRQMGEPVVRALQFRRASGSRSEPWW